MSNPNPNLYFFFSSKIGAASTLNGSNIHRGRPGFPVICWRNEKSLKSVISTEDVKDDKGYGIDDVKIIDRKIRIEKMKDNHDDKDEDKDKEIVQINKDIEIEKEKKIEIEIEKNRSREEKEKNEINENFDNLYNKRTLKILPDNCGTIFSIEASTCGATF